MTFSSVMHLLDECDLMVVTLSIVITILRFQDKFVFIKRKNPPYENLWSLVGGKVKLGEHIATAAIREVREETGTNRVDGYKLKTMISERLVSPSGELESHFMIYLGDARIHNFENEHKEGHLSTFTLSEVSEKANLFLPSDLKMFLESVNRGSDCILYNEAELVRDGTQYSLNYYREGHS